MADMKALFTQRFNAARAALTQGDDPAAAESLHWAIVAARGDPSLRRELASALFHLGKVSRKFGRAGETEAEQLLTEALTISEELFGAEHSALVPVLNELTRVHVQRSQHARAEELLERLLAIAQLKGDETVDVASALAGLAVVKRKLGNDAAAEALYRDALRIREKVLEPNHMVIVVTLEQLSETCAAQGNVAEALELLQRAVPIREASLGPGHETVRVARTRLAELELQVAIAADTAAVAAARAARGAMRTPAWFKAAPPSPMLSPTNAEPLRIDSKELEFLGEPEPPALRPAPLSRERAKTPAVAAAVAAASMLAARLPTPAAPLTAVPENATDRAVPVEHHEVALPNITYAEITTEYVAPSETESSVALVHEDPVEPAPKNRKTLYMSGGAAAATIAIAALVLMRPNKPNGKPAASVSQQGAPASIAAAPAASASTPAATRAETVQSAAAKPTTNASVAQPEKRGAQNAAPELQAPNVQIHLGALNIPNVPPPTTSVDSIIRSAAQHQRTPDSDRVGTIERPAPAPAEIEEVVATPPKIIGRAPVPRFPDALLRSVRTDGEVIVRFRVNEAGKVDVGSMIVVQSDHDLFTAAVRDILSQFRFEPARTRAPESKPVAAWVSVPFRFKAR